MSAITHEIPIDQWLNYFNELSRLYQGWAVTIEVLGGKLGDQPAANGVPLQGISFETKGGSAAGDILVEVGDVGTPYEMHRVQEPRIVRTADTQPGAETDIEIESRDRTVTIVRIRRRPELPPAR
jgi:hypothetical protein